MASSIESAKRIVKSRRKRKRSKSSGSTNVLKKATGTSRSRGY